MIYFDNSATSFYKPEIVKQRVMVALEKFTANAGRSGHKPSQDVAEIVYDTREMVKNFFGAKNYEVIFTKNCSEALNLAILGTLKSGDHVITTMFEHNSVLRPLEYLKSKGVEVSYLDCELKDLDTKIVSHIKSNTKMLITTAMSNVTGDITNIERLGLICEKYNIIYLVDGAQASGHIDINLTDSYVDMFTFSGHKGLLSLTGVGALVVKKGTILSNILLVEQGQKVRN
ncbi:MAG: aminotransferase class V-fold PLP-dependent enzyme [Clostridia bacterium]|nr:aminotransferase class V-fold PLP-dependent enzyme [Clostridia bacterium]